MTTQEKRQVLVSRYNTAARAGRFEERDKLFAAIQNAVDECTMAVSFDTVKTKDGWFLLATLMESQEG